MTYIIARAYDMGGELEYLQHHGIKGQKWGIRRYENPDGTLTDAGKVRYAKSVRDAKQYKTAGERLKTIGKAGKAGAALGAGLIVGSGAAVTAHKMFSKSYGTYIGETNAMAQAAATLIAAPAVGGMLISSIRQGYQAAKVKRGQDFIAKYQDAYNKTYGRQA